MTELSSIVDKFGVYIYKNPLIYFRVETFSNWKHRELTADRDPMANAYICKLDEEIFSENPIFTPDLLTKPKEPKKDEFGIEIPNENENQDFDESMLIDWINEGWIDLLIDIFNSGRTHSWCIVELYDRAPYWRVFTWRELEEMIYDKYDNPIGAKLHWSYTLPTSTKPREHKRTIMFNRNTPETMKHSAIFIPFGHPKGGDLGTYDLKPIWDLLIYARYQVLDIINNSAKTSGFFHLIYGNAIKPSQKTDLINAFDYTGIGQAIGAKENVLQDIKFHCAQNPEFTIEALNETLTLLAGATRLPLAFYKGEKDSGGVFQEGFSDESKVTKKKKYIFGQFKKYIIQLVQMRWGKVVTDVQPYIDEEVKQDAQKELEAKGQFEQDHFSGKEKKETNKVA